MFTLNSTNFKNLIESVYLNGIIDECVLDVKNGIGIIQSIDKLNCLFVSNFTKITNDKDFELKIGFKDISILSKILTNIKEDKDVKYEISKDEKWLVLDIKERGKIKLLLVEPDTLVTAVSGNDIVSKLKENTLINIELTEKIKSDILYFLQMCKSKIVNFNIVKNKLYLQSHDSDVHQFNISIGKVIADDISIEINGSYLATILISLDNKTKSKIYLGKDNPILIDSIIEDNNYLWALSPISVE